MRVTGWLSSRIVIRAWELRCVLMWPSSSKTYSAGKISGLIMSLRLRNLLFLNKMSRKQISRMSLRVLRTLWFRSIWRTPVFTKVVNSTCAHSWLSSALNHGSSTLILAILVCPYSISQWMISARRQKKRVFATSPT